MYGRLKFYRSHNLLTLRIDGKKSVLSKSPSMLDEVIYKEISVVRLSKKWANFLLNFGFFDCHLPQLCMLSS